MTGQRRTAQGDTKIASSDLSFINFSTPGTDVWRRQNQSELEGPEPLDQTAPAIRGGDPTRSATAGHVTDHVSILGAFLRLHELTGAKNNREFLHPPPPSKFIPRPGAWTCQPAPLPPYGEASSTASAIALGPTRGRAAELTGRDQRHRELRRPVPSPLTPGLADGRSTRLSVKTNPARRASCGFYLDTQFPASVPSICLNSSMLRGKTFQTPANRSDALGSKYWTRFKKSPTFIL